MRLHAMAAREAPPSEVPASPEAQSFRHLPVLLEPVLALVPERARLFVDATLGAGGHAEALLARHPRTELFGCDRDGEAVEAARERLAPFASRILLKRLPFSQLHHHVLLGSVDFLLADLGVSSPQLDRAERGFSFTRDGPLDMRMEPEEGGRTAAELVNTASHERLVQLFRTLGEERFASRIATAILGERARSAIATTGRLAELVAAAVPARFHRKGHHPATKVFQAFRMAVNDELGELEQLLDRALDLLRPGGRVAVISFHSLEDRLVKTAFRKWEQPCECPTELPLCVCGKTPLGARVTRRPIGPDPAEARANPRSRSAKLRAFEKS